MMTEPTPEIALVEQLRQVADVNWDNDSEAEVTASEWREQCVLMQAAADLLSRLGREREQYRVQVEERYGAVAQWQEHAEMNRLAWLKSEATVSRLWREHRALREWVEKWRNRADRGFDPEEAPETTAYWAAIRRFTDELDAGAGLAVSRHHGGRRSDMTDPIHEQAEREIASILAPAIDVRAPYAKQMIRALADLQFAKADAALVALRTQVRALVEKWRGDVSEDGGPWEAGEAFALEYCAHELHAALTAYVSPAGAPPAKEP